MKPYLSLFFILVSYLSVLFFGAAAKGDNTSKSVIGHSGSDIVGILSFLNRPTSHSQCGNSVQSSPASTTDEKGQWNSAGFLNPEIRVISPNPAITSDGNFTHSLKMTFVLFRNSGWTEERVQANLSRTAEIYKQCGIKISEAKLVVADAPNGLLDVSTGNKDDDMIAQKTPVSKKPVIYFIRSDVEHRFAFSWVFLGENISSAKFNTTWLTQVVDKESFTKFSDPSYNILAHEVGHVLCGCGHFIGSEKNLMAGSQKRLNDHLDQDQCEAFKKSNLLEKLP